MANWGSGLSEMLFLLDGVFFLDSDVMSGEDLVEIDPLLAASLTQKGSLLRLRLRLNDLIHLLWHLYGLLVLNDL